MTRLIIIGISLIMGKIKQMYQKFHRILSTPKEPAPKQNLNLFHRQDFRSV